MRVQLLLLACILLAGCGLSPAYITETAMAAQTQTKLAAATATPSSTPLPNITATYQAIRAATQTQQVLNSRVRLTELAAPTATAIAEAGSMFEEIQAAADEIDNLDLSEGKLVYGPRDDTLTQGPYDFVVVDNARLLVKNFIVSIEFTNPYDTSTTGTWDYGVLFRNKYGNNQYRLIVLSNQSWSLYDAESDKYIYSSNDKRINSKTGDKNLFWLIVVESNAYLFINGEYVRTLDVSTRVVNGDVSPATGLYAGNMKSNKITEYQNFTVWSLP